MAKGGQILVSEDVFDKIKEHLDELGNPEIIELGEFELKGLEKKEFIRQVSPYSLKDRKFEPNVPQKNPFEQKAEDLEDKLKKLEEENKSLLEKMSQLEQLSKNYIDEANQVIFFYLFFIIFYFFISLFLFIYFFFLPFLFF
jgi:hypothetical protein